MPTSSSERSADPNNAAGATYVNYTTGIRYPVPLHPARPIWRVDTTATPWRVMCHGCAMRKPFPQARHGYRRLFGRPAPAWRHDCGCGRVHPIGNRHADHHKEGRNDGQ